MIVLSMRAVEGARETERETEREAARTRDSEREVDGDQLDGAGEADTEHS